MKTTLPAPTKRQLHTVAQALADDFNLVAVAHLGGDDVLRLAEDDDIVVAVVRPYRRQLSSWSHAEPAGIEVRLSGVRNSGLYSIHRGSRTVLDPLKPIPMKLKLRLGELVEAKREQLSAEAARHAARKQRDKLNRKIKDERIQVYDTKVVGEFELGATFTAPLDALPQVREALAYFDKLMKEKTT